MVCIPIEQAVDIAQDDTVVATVNLAHLRHNARILQRRIGDAGLMAVVKSNAYGHGAVPVVRTLHDAGVRHFAVARVAEAVGLREAGLTAPVLVLGAPLPDHLPRYAAHDLDVTISSRAVAEAAVALATPERPLRVHLKVDTGMARIGLPPDEVPPILALLRQAPGIHLAGLWTHFATASYPDDAFAHQQLDRFETLVRDLGPLDDVEHIHAANSGALFFLRRSYRAFDAALVRAGITLYGLTRIPNQAQETGLRPALTLSAQITHIKTVAPGTSVSYDRTWKAPCRTRIATLGVGYGDGYPRILSNRSEVGLRGHRYPVAGTICMDMMMIDLGPPGTPASDAVSVGDWVTLYGPDGPSMVEVAQRANTIPYEICCGIAPRVPRRYIDAP